MCGILGIVGANPDRVGRAAFDEALALMRHRGPDESDTWWHVDDSGALNAFGHQRLRIIDLHPTSRQPMYSDDGRYVLIFNGEIYNYLELRAELEAGGHTFRTRSDTEVLLASFARHGIECVHRFIGMFAFAIHDLRRNATWIVRDRLGIKPVWLQRGPDELLFASEIKSILALSDKPKELNPAAVSSYLSFRYPILDDSFIAGIESLPPGHFLHFEDGKQTISEYWDPAHAFAAQADDRGEGWYIEQVRETLESAVRYRMIADVPLGAYLSGGVDSSVITALMARQSSEPVKTFTIGFEEKGYNEFEYARLVAERYDTEHREILISGERYIEEMERLISFKDAPLAVPNEVPLHLMSRELKKYITVVLSGEGADEIFCGYGRIYRSPDDFEKLKSATDPDFLARAARKYGTTYFASELDHFLNVYSYTDAALKRRLLASDFNNASIDDGIRQKFQGLFDRVADQGYTNKIAYTFEKIHLLGLLQRVDMTTMATSVEARVPFVDHRLVELAFSIPIDYKLRWNDGGARASKLLLSDEISEVHDTPKYILKRACEDLLPEEVLYRRKMGFPVPLNDWFGGRFRDYARDHLLSARAAQRGIYNAIGIREILDGNALEDDHALAMKIWMLVNLELFCEAYL
jgi:asparagine synthase (glutamine-hydrolysing)